MRIVQSLLILLTTLVLNASAQHLIAHRGASHDAPENTLTAFRLAWEQGADGIEGDFRLTADRQVVCFHDEDTLRVSGQKLVVEDSTLAQLQQLDVGAWKDAAFRGERIPTLAEVLNTVPHGKLILIEVKCGPEIVGPMAKALAASGIKQDQVVIISFNADVLRECRKRTPQYKTQWLSSFRQQSGRWSPTPKEVAESIRSCGADAFGSQAETRCFDEDYLAKLQELGVREFGVWTVDEVETARLYQSLGAWSITTNRPGWMREQLDR